jgi:hypothetical protein
LLNFSKNVPYILFIEPVNAEQSIVLFGKFA